MAHVKSVSVIPTVLTLKYQHYNTVPMVLNAQDSEGPYQYLNGKEKHINSKEYLVGYVGRHVLNWQVPCL